MFPTDSVNPLYYTLIWSTYKIYVSGKLGQGGHTLKLKKTFLVKMAEMFPNTFYGLRSSKNDTIKKLSRKVNFKNINT